jgi:hypothetical protein
MGAKRVAAGSGVSIGARLPARALASLVGGCALLNHKNVNSSYYYATFC